MGILSNTAKIKLEVIKSHFDAITQQNGSLGISIQDAINAIKKVMEESKDALIRSQKPIKMIHEAVKTAFIQNKVNPSLIKPTLFIKNINF